MPAKTVTADQLRYRLLQGVQQLDLQLQLQQQHQDQLIQFVQLLGKWNRVYNLTAVRSMDEMIDRHILDSLSVLRWLDNNDLPAASKPATDVLDVGSGAGLPVIPLAIVRPDLMFLSVESNGKKARFQQQAVMELKLGNVRVLQERIEEVTDVAATCLSRAFTAPSQFLEAVEKNCVPQSRVILMLGQKERMSDVLPGNFECSELVEVSVPGCAAARHIATCTKVK